MSIDAVAGIAATSLSAPAASSAVQPTAQQAASFEQQLQLPNVSAQPSSYGAPSSGTAGVDLHPLMDYAGQLSNQLSTQLESVGAKTDTTYLDPRQAAAVQAMDTSFEKVRNLGVTTLQFQFFTNGVQIADGGARMLFQQT
jgi:hypothetical protein